MSRVGVKLETIIHNGSLLVFATTRLNLTCPFPGCNNTNIHTNEKTMFKHMRKMHHEMPITIILFSNQELWKLKPNRDIVPHNNET